MIALAAGALLCLWVLSLIHLARVNAARAQVDHAFYEWSCLMTDHLETLWEAYSQLAADLAELRTEQDLAVRRGRR